VTKMTRSGAFRAILVAAFFVVSTAFMAAQKKNSKEWKPDDKVYEALSKAPKKAVERQNPLTRDPDAVAAGANLFDQHCAECHGDLAEGSRKGPSLRLDPVLQSAPGTLFWILTNGVSRSGGSWSAT
jgi:mono/diheme cytochrome c family protein